MSVSQVLIVTGLLLDVIGVCLLFAFGLPSKYEGPGMLLLFPGKDKLGDRGRKRIRLGAYAGLTLLIVGFLLQIVGTIYR